MLPTIHLLLGLLFSALLFILGIPTAFILIILAASVLIDIDHYILYAFIKKDINPFNAYKFYLAQGKKYRNKKKYQLKKYQFASLQIFHTIEFFLLLALLSCFSEIALLIFIGCIFHMCADLIENIVTKQVYLKAPSLFFRNKKIII
jgi:hypothetical protein